MLLEREVLMSLFSAELFDTVIKVTILLLLVTIAAAVLRRRSASLRHMLWSFALGGMIVLPLLSWLSPIRWYVLPGGAAVSESVEKGAPALTDVAGQTRNGPSDGQVAVVSAADPTADGGFARAVEANGAIALTTWFVVAWVSGTVILLFRYAFGLLLVGRVARNAREITDESWHRLADRAAAALGTGPVEIRQTAAVAMPFACGLRSPVIVLPADADNWPHDRREAVLMHEVAHISRGDLFMNALSHITRAIYWFHPLAWVAAHRLRVEGERACDDAVLRAGARPSDYAEHLLTIVRSVGSTVPNVALAMARRSDFEGRLLAILEPGVPRSQMSRSGAAGAFGLFLSLMLPLAALTPQQAPAMSSMQAEEVARPAGQTQAAAQAITALIETLSDENAAVRAAAVSSLGKLQDPRAINALAKALREDADPRVREAAAYALGEIDDARAVNPLIEALRAERNATVRERIVEALGELEDPSAVAGISAVLKDPSVGVRRAAVRALGEFDDPRALPGLLSMARDEDVEVRRNVADALGSIGNGSAFEALSILARDGDAEVRSNAVNSLGNLEDRRALPILIAALKDSDAHVRQHAADAIDDLDEISTAPPALIEALTDANRDVRVSVAEALGNIGDEAAVPGLRRLLSDNDANVRRAGAEALSDIGGAEAIQALMGLLKDSDPEIRRIAAEALGSRKR